MTNRNINLEQRDAAFYMWNHSDLAPLRNNLPTMKQQPNPFYNKNKIQFHIKVEQRVPVPR